ncbi:MAG: tyrosine-type recombinase/integrase, partial [Actinomycetota bacterium]|nr:tyrosine-type recombinase/integrase [Actinomycetota bacterium]
KGRKERMVPISEELRDAIDEHLLTPYPVLERDPELTDHVWYAIWTRGPKIIRVTPEREFSYRGFWEWWQRLEKHAGVRHRRPHMARHTFATDVLDATEGDLHATKELLGHASTRTTEGYIHSSRRRGAAAIDALLAYRRRESEDGHE